MLYWLLLEFSSFLFLICCRHFSSNCYYPDLVFFYLITQSVPSVVVFLCFSLNSAFPYCSTLFEFLFYSSVCFKLGLFPLCFWVFSVSRYLTHFCLFLLVVPHKLPLMFLVYLVSPQLLIFMGFLNMFSGCIYLFNSYDLKSLIVSSGMYNFFFLVSTVFFSFKLFLFNFVLYLLLVSLLQSLLIPGRLFISLAVILALVGFPPSSSFLLKFYFSQMMSLSSLFSFFSFLFVSMFVTVSMFCYYRLFVLDLSFSSPSLYNLSVYHGYSVVVISVLFLYPLFF